MDLPTGWWSDFVQDVRVAARAIAHHPSTAIVPVLSSALGVSVCTVVVGIANVALFRPLPVAAGAGLMSITARDRDAADAGGPISFPEFRELSAARSTIGMAAYFPMLPAAISQDGTGGRRYWGTIATANYFDIVRPGFALGGGFDPAGDDQPGAPPVIVLSHRLWISEFGGSRTVLGRNLMINGRTATVAGVTGAGFRGTDVGMASDFWLPLSMREMVIAMLPAGRVSVFDDPDAKWLFALARLSSRSRREHLSAEVNVIAARLAAAYPQTNSDRTLHAERAGQLLPAVRRAMRTFFLLLLAVSSLVLFTACANIANLLLARATVRHKEMTVRRALGAGRGRLVRQLLTESVLLACAGGALGFGLASLGVHSFGRLRLPVALPVDLTVSLDRRVLLVCTVLSVATGVAFGLGPALQAGRGDLVSGLKDAGWAGRARGRNARNLLMVGQVAICMVLLVCSGLFLRALDYSRSIDTGMAHRNVALIGFDPFGRLDGAQRDSYLDGILRRAVDVAGVESAALSTAVPLSLAGTSGSVGADDGVNGKSTAVDSDIYRVSPGFFETLGIRILAGSDFRQEHDDVVIVNRALADRLFRDDSPIDRHLRADGRSLRIIGVVANSKSRTIVEAPRPSIFRPMFGHAVPYSFVGVTLLVRTRGAPDAYLRPVTAAMQTADRGLAVFDARTMDQHLNSAMLLQRAGAALFGFTGLVGIVIAGTGLYGLTSFLVARQTREISIRMAVGATRGQIVVAVLRHGLGLTATGCAVGFALSMALTHTMASLVPGVSPNDWLTFAAVTAFLFTITLIACLVPAYRAASVAPAVSMQIGR